jgi:hypothetical protein
MDATINELRDELSRLHGPARLPTLTRLGHEYARSYWRTGSGRPAALPDLSAAIELWQEAYGLVGSTDPARGQVAFQLGWLLAARFAVHGSGPADRDTGIAVLGAALTSSDLPPTQVTIANLALGQLFLSNVTESMSPAALHGGLPGGPSDAAKTDADEAIRCFRAAIDGAPSSAEVMAAASAMLAVAEAILPLVSGDMNRFDMSRIMEAAAVLQRLQQNGFPGFPGAAPGHGPASPFVIPFSLGPTLDSVDYPVTLIQGDASQGSSVPPRRPPSAAPVPVERDALRDQDSARLVARARLAVLIGDRGQPVWEQARDLLYADPDQLASGELDAFVGLAADAVDEAAATGGTVDTAAVADPVEAGLDRLIFAVGLCVRQRRDGDGWGGDGSGGAAENTTGGVKLAAARLLDTAATLIPTTHPAAAVVVTALGGLLDETRPLSGPITEIADPLGRYSDGITARSAIVSAIGELCRTVTAIRSGTFADPEPVTAAVAALPQTDPWHRPLSAAVGHARLVVAVRAGDLDAVQAALSTTMAPAGFAVLLEALIRRDPTALRSAVEGIGTNLPRPPAPMAAILGAARLELAIRAPEPGGSDIAEAVRLLVVATQASDDSTADGLRTRAWWRLATAYRCRSDAGDCELSRDAGWQALHGVGPDARYAARFAGWMLAEGRCEEAFTALEVAAAAPEPKDVDQLIEDALSVVLGVAPPAAPPARVPTWTEVATAVRQIGAAALLYLHPTDDAGRTAAVLCLDPGTDHLDVLANVPVTDPLARDDPGWPAILGRWTTGSLLLASTGGLDRIALPAVRTGGDRFLIQDVVVSHVASGAEAIALAGRPAAPVDAEPVFVVNPRGDRDAEMVDVLLLRRLFYPTSVCLGHALEPADAAGTRDDVLARLSGASLVHLACGLRRDGRTEWQLADGEVLTAAEIRSLGAAAGGGLVILAEPCPDGFRSDADVLVDAGFAGVIGWQWLVPAPFAALALFMTHLMLADHRLPPASAVNAVQRWMLDPDRSPPPFMTAAQLSTVATIDLTRPSYWAALTYRGR